MTISLIASTKNEGYLSAAAGLSVNVPAGVTDNDKLLAFTSGSDDQNTMPTPAGWTLIGQIGSSTGSDVRQAVFARTASSEPASYVFTHGDGVTNQHLGVVMQCWRGVDAVILDAVFITGHRAHNSNDDTPPNQSITTVTNDAVSIVAMSGSAGLTPGAPASYTADPVYCTGNSRFVTVAHRTIAAAGLESPADWGNTGGTDGSESFTITLALRPAASRSIIDIDGDNSIEAGGTEFVISSDDIDISPIIQVVQLDGQALTITDWNGGDPIITVPAGIAIKRGRTDLDLVVTDDTGSITLPNVTLLSEAGWDYVEFSGTVPDGSTQPGYIAVQADYAYDMIAGDQWLFKNETGLSFDADTVPTLNPERTITSEYRVWDDTSQTMTVKTSYNIAQVPKLSSGSFTA